MTVVMDRHILFWITDTRFSTNTVYRRDLRWIIQYLICTAAAVDRMPRNRKLRGAIN